MRDGRSDRIHACYSSSLLRYMDHDVHILQLLLFFCSLVMKVVKLLVKLIENSHV